MNLLTADELEARLRDIGARRYHRLHPFHQLLHCGQCSKGQVQAWALNRYYYQAMIPVKDASLIARCDDQATRRELEKMVQQALAQVSPELREAVILRDLQDMDYKEIAQVLGIPEGTVKSRISRGRAELARLLERNKREVM